MASNRSIIFVQVFDSLNLTAYDINVDTLDVHAVSKCLLVSRFYSDLYTLNIHSALSPAMSFKLRGWS